MTIPVQRPSLGPAELQAVGKVFDSRWLGMGSTTKEFEDRIRTMLGVRHVISVNTGTSALHLALDGLGVGAGDEVVVPSLTFAASIQAIVQTGATPVFCEVSPDTLNLDLDDAFARVTPRTKVIMPVHYGGLACPMDDLLRRSRAAGLKVVEDAAHAFGSTYKGRPIGGLGDLTCFSFDPIKNITCGEGGAITTNDDELAPLLMAKRILGIDNDTWSRYKNERTWLYQVVTPGFRYHLANINAAIGLVQLDSYELFRSRKREIVREYDAAFHGLPGLTLIRHDLDEMFPFFYIVRVLDGRRDALMQALKGQGIGSGVHYIPNHLQPLFGTRVSLPTTEQIFEEILTLPLYYEMTDADVGQVVKAVKKFLAEARS